MLNEFLLKSDKDHEVYYLDTESDSEKTAIQEFYQKFSIDGVPTLFYIRKDGSYEVLNEDDILPEWIDRMIDN